MDGVSTDSGDQSRLHSAPVEPGLVARVRAWLEARVEADPAPHLRAQLERAQAIAGIVADIGIDEEVVAGALLYPFVDSGALGKQAVADAFGPDIAQLVRELVRLGAFGFPVSWEPERGLFYSK